MRKIFWLLLLSLVYNLHAQTNPTNLIEFKIIDSLSSATNPYGRLWYWGYGDVHFTTNGNRILLAAKKTYIDPQTNKAGTHLLFGERQNFGKWDFENLYTYSDSTHFSPVKAMLMYGQLPIVFFTDKNVNAYSNLFFTNETGTGWATTTLITDPHNDSNPDNDDITESYDNKNFSISQGENGATVYWWRDNYDELSPGNWKDRWQLVYSNWATGEDTVIWSSPYGEIVDKAPAVTEDGEYVAFSFHSKDSEGHNYWGIRVFRKTNYGYVQDLADSSMEDVFGGFFGLAIGKKPNGDVLLIAKNSSDYMSSPVWVKSAGIWSKVTDNYPQGPNTDTYLLSSASSRYLNNERIQFSKNGTAFWGDMDGWVTYTTSAEISFYTPDGRFGHFYFPKLPYYQGNGSFEYHDFCITDDDTLHIVYNYKPSVENPSMYLVEGKLYIPDLLNLLTGIEDENHQQFSFKLFQNYPNPFNPTTTIKYSIPTSSPLAKGRTEEEFVTLKVYDVLGREIKTLVNKKQSPGNYTVEFNAASAAGGLPSGLYFYKLTAGSFSQTKKMILMK